MPRASNEVEMQANRSTTGERLRVLLVEDSRMFTSALKYRFETDLGVDVVTCHVDSPKVLVETAAKRGLFVCGYHADQSVLASQHYLTGAEWNWETVYRGYVEALQTGQPFANLTRGGLKDGFVRMSAYTEVTPRAAVTRIDDVKAQMLAGRFDIFKGPLKDNQGNTVIAAGTTLAQTDLTLESMDYLVEGVIGATGG